MTWNADSSAEVLRAYRENASRLIKRLNAALADPPPLSSGVDPLLQAARYEQLSAAGAWKDLHAKAAADQKQAEQALRTIAKAQVSVGRIASERKKLPPPPAGGFKLNELPNWRDVRHRLLAAAADSGVDDRFAGSYARQVGQIRIDVADLGGHTDGVVAEQGQQLNALARSHLRQWAGASLCQVLARFNDGKPTGSDPAGVHDALRDQERAVWHALKAQGDAKDEVEAYASASRTELTRCVRRLRSLPDDAEQLLDATLDAEAVLEGTILARYFRWFLGWQADLGLDDGLRAFAQRPFEKPGGAWETTLGAHRYRDSDAAWRVNAARCAFAGTHIDVSSGTDERCRLAVHNVDLGYFGFTGTGFVRVAEARRRETEDHLVDVPVSGAGPDWRSSVRQRIRGMYNPIPFGLSVAWSWQRGPDGAIAQVTNCGWFS
jgi:hypothetical protein